MRKPILGVYDQVRHKPDCTATVCRRLEISDLGQRRRLCYLQSTNKRALISCTVTAQLIWHAYMRIYKKFLFFLGKGLSYAKTTKSFSLGFTKPVALPLHHGGFSLVHAYILSFKIINGRPRECHNKKAQSIPCTKRKRNLPKTETSKTTCKQQQKNQLLSSPTSSSSRTSTFLFCQTRRPKFIQYQLIYGYTCSQHFHK